MDVVSVRFFTEKVGMPGWELEQHEPAEGAFVEGPNTADSANEDALCKTQKLTLNSNG